MPWRERFSKRRRARWGHGFPDSPGPPRRAARTGHRPGEPVPRKQLLDDEGALHLRMHLTGERILAGGQVLDAFHLVDVTVVGQPAGEARDAVAALVGVVRRGGATGDHLFHAVG